MTICVLGRIVVAFTLGAGKASGCSEISGFFFGRSLEDKHIESNADDKGLCVAGTL